MVASGLSLRGNLKNYTRNQNTLCTYFYVLNLRDNHNLSSVYWILILKSELSGIVLILQLKTGDQSG